MCVTIVDIHFPALTVYHQCHSQADWCKYWYKQYLIQERIITIFWTQLPAIEYMEDHGWVMTLFDVSCPVETKVNMILIRYLALRRRALLNRNFCLISLCNTACDKTIYGQSKCNSSTHYFYHADVYSIISGDFYDIYDPGNYWISTDILLQ